MVKSELIENYVKRRFSSYGASKKREVIRLLFEIAKRENCDYRQIIEGSPGRDLRFDEVRSYLIKRRFPSISREEKSPKFNFPELKINPEYRADVSKTDDNRTYHFFVEKSVVESSFVLRLKKKFADARFTTIPGYSEYTRSTRYTIKDYNDRLKTYFIIKENYDFFKRCACSNDSVYCGYHVVNLGSGCPFDCAYCYLPSYINSPGILLPANLEDFFEQFKKYKQNIRLGSGELTDSLAFDHITEYSIKIVEFFKKYPKSSFEFKTKSNNIKNLLSVKPGNNIIVSWSVNPDRIVDAIEHKTSSLTERLEAAQECIDGGYKVAFHFDPVIYYEEWEDDYRKLINRIYKQIDRSRIAWVSVGTLRMTKNLKKIIENRFPENKILDEEFVSGYDGKFRYGQRRRARIYSKMKEWIRSHDRDVPLYLCMEEKALCYETETLPSKELVYA